MPNVLLIEDDSTIADAIAELLTDRGLSVDCASNGIEWLDKARSHPPDLVRGLNMGGDDYLTKPFAAAELCARVEALLRRPAQTREVILRVGPLELDRIRRTAKRGGRKIELAPRQYRLLEYMMGRADQLLTRDVLLKEVWG